LADLPAAILIILDNLGGIMTSPAYSFANDKFKYCEKTQPSTSGLSARSIRHTQRLLFKSEEDQVDDASSTVSHDGHMSDDDSGDEIMFRNEERCISGVGGIQPKSRIPVPVNGLFSSHVVNKKYLILLLKIIINMCSTIYLFGSVK
jgi:hypothetical protein